MATKNNPKGRGAGGNKKTLNGKDIEPIMYVGKYIGDGTYVATKYAKTSDMVFDANKKPIAWKNVGNEG